MKQLLFLLLFPCLAMAQYQGNGNQKITLGEQTSADGLVYRGVANLDTVAATSKITRANKQDTSAFLLLDTVTNLLWHYKTGSNAWTQAGGGDTSLIAYVNTYGTQTVNGAKTFTSAVTGARFNPTSSTATGTGIFLPATNTLGFSINGTSQMRINSNGSTSFGNTTLNDLQLIAVSNAQNVAEFSGVNPNVDPNNGGIFMRFRNLSNINGTQQSLIFADSSRSAVVLLQAYNINTITHEGAFAIGLRNASGTYGQRLYIKGSGEAGFGLNSPTARIHIAAGTATTAPIRLSSSGATLLSSLESGAIEFNGTNLLFTPSTTRHTVNHGLTGSATLDFPNTSANTYSDLTISITGAALSDVVSLGIPNASMSANNITYTAWVSAANTVTVRFANHTTGSIDPASGTFKVFVTK